MHFFSKAQVRPCEYRMNDPTSDLNITDPNDTILFERLDNQKNIHFTAWYKSETRTPAPGTWDPGPGTPLKFKSGTLGPPSKFKSNIPGHPSKFKSGTPHLSLINSFVLEYLIVFYLCDFFK